MSNLECKIRPVIMNINIIEPLFYPHNILLNNCSGSCNYINNPYGKFYVPHIVKNMNIKVFNLMSKTNETRHISWCETCTYNCRLDTSNCNNEEHWNNDQC